MTNYWELTKAFSNPTNQEVVREFLLHLKVQNCSEGTLMVYRNFLERFFGEMEESFSELSSEKIQDWVFKEGKNVKEATIRFRLSVLSSFYTFCHEEGYIETSPMKRRWFPRLPQTIPKYLGKAELAKTRHQSETISLRDRLLVEFLLATGCRIGEVQQLDTDQIDLENRTARIVGKGGRIRQVHFTDKVAILLEKYLEERPKDKSSALFVSRTGKRLTKRRLQQIITELGDVANIPGSLHAHRFRHTFATELLAKGADIGFIKDELGHSDIATTQIYARLPDREVIAQYRKYMG